MSQQSVLASMGRVRVAAVGTGHANMVVCHPAEAAVRICRLVSSFKRADSARRLRQNRSMRLHQPSAALLLCAALCAASPAVAQGAAAPARTAATEAADAAPVEVPGTDDAWIDRQLLDIDRYAARYPDSFLDEIARYAQMPHGYAEVLLHDRRWPPRDVYVAAFLAKAAGRPYREVVRARTAAGVAAGWATVASDMDAPPGSLAYRALRHAIVASYDHWDRPIVLDALLRRQLGDRAARDRAAAQPQDGSARTQ
ncbi:hypothetical protein L3067_08345 [Xanthomonas sp. PPL568]|uniref:hypothetical protein n=1 Tax=Xanthomonas indica TaxID=2912242 RepID=UPI001F5A74A3|nr:hypothetical protein [Xanthomonas indica]MCI2244619.1 hypothetical protein [Xanthomonas indica]